MLLISCPLIHSLCFTRMLLCVLQVVTSVVMAFCFSFVRVSVSSVLRREGGRSQLLYCGIFTQLGSFCGALVSFILVAVVKVFYRLSPCAHWRSSSLSLLRHPRRGAEYCNQDVCLSVSVFLSASISLKPVDWSSRKFLCRSPVAVARSSSGVAIHYVFLVLWMTSRLAVMGLAAVRYRGGIWCRWMQLFLFCY